MLIRLPLPLSSFVGKILRSGEYEKLEGLVTKLHEVKEKYGTEDHRARLIQLLDYTEVPLEAVYRNSLTLIARDDINFSLELDGVKK